MKKNSKTIAVVLGMALGAALPLAAQAQTTLPGVYAGIGAGQAEPLQYDTCDTRPTCKKKGSAYRFFGGYQFSRSVPELLMVGVGLPLVVTVKVFAVPTVNVVLLALVIPGASPDGVTVRVKESNGGITFAGGLQFFMTQSLALRGEGQRYMKVGGGKLGDSDYSVYTVGLLWKFR